MDVLGQSDPRTFWISSRYAWILCAVEHAPNAPPPPIRLTSIFTVDAYHEHHCSLLSQVSLSVFPFHVPCFSVVHSEALLPIVRRDKCLPCFASAPMCFFLSRPGVMPSQLDGETAMSRPSEDDAPFSALAFKIMSDPFVGTLTFTRIYSGVLESGTSVYNSVKVKHNSTRPHWEDEGGTIVVRT